MKTLHFCNYIAHKKPIRYAFKCNKQKLSFLFFGLHSMLFSSSAVHILIETPRNSLLHNCNGGPRTTAIRTLAE